MCGAGLGAAPAGRMGLDNRNQTVFTHALFPYAAVFVGKLSNYLSFGFFGKTDKSVSVTKVPDGHVADLKLTGSFAFATTNRLNLNGSGHDFRVGVEALASLLISYTLVRPCQP